MTTDTDLQEVTVSDDQVEALWEEVAAERAQDAPEDNPLPRSELDEGAAKPVSFSNDATPADQPPSQPPEDPVAVMRGQLEALQRAVQDTDRRARTAEGRVSALQSELDRAKQSQQAPSATEILDAAKSDEKWQALKSDWPEMAESVEAYIAKTLAGQRASGVGKPAVDQDAMAAFVNSEVARVQQDAAGKIAALEVEVAHRGWKSTVKTPEFGTWLQAQPPAIQALGASDQSADAVRMLDLFAEHRKRSPAAVQNQRRQVLEAARTNRPNQTAGSLTKSVADMTEDELWDYEARQRARRSAQAG